MEGTATQLCGKPVKLSWGVSVYWTLNKIIHTLYGKFDGISIIRVIKAGTEFIEQLP